MVSPKEVFAPSQNLTATNYVYIMSHFPKGKKTIHKLNNQKKPQCFFFSLENSTQIQHNQYFKASRVEKSAWLCSLSTIKSAQIN